MEATPVPAIDEFPNWEKGSVYEPIMSEGII